MSHKEISQSKLVSLMISLDKKEKTQFLNLLKNEKDIKIFNAFKGVLTKAARLQKLDTNHAIIFKKIENKDTTVKDIDSKVKSLKSQLSQKIEDFLIMKKLEEKPIDRGMYLLEIYHERKLDNLTNNQGNAIQKNIEKLSPLNNDRYYWEYRLNYTRFFEICESRYKDKGINLKKASKAFLIYSHLEQLKYAYEMKSRSISKNEIYDTDF